MKTLRDATLVSLGNLHNMQMKAAIAENLLSMDEEVK